VGLPICIRSGPFEVVDHVKNSGVVTDDVKVAIIDEGLVIFQAEFNILSSIIHEHIDHGKVNISLIREVQVSNMQGLPKIPFLCIIS
jgi:hypothetical protein